MSAHLLQLRYGDRPLREAAAWFLPGDNPGAWLDEVVGWGVPHAALVLRVVPQSRQDLRPRGVLVTGPAGTKPAVSPCCLAYGRLAGRMFLPVEGWLDPDVSEGELARLLSGDLEYVFHPAAGLVGFERGDLLRVADLLGAPPRSGAAWDRARPGVAFPRRLTVLMAEEVPTLESILESGRGDIGSSSGSPTGLPPAPNERPLPDLPEQGEGAVRRAGRQARRALARMLRWLTGKAPATAKGPTWVDRVRDWAGRQLAGLADALAARRRRELDRLMHLLDEDPDRGLRYALPMGGGAHRGLAPPGDRLARRDVNFDLGRLGGGGPADFWDVPPDYHSQLVARYRRLADREVRLGRHRRAAYIYAELLGDLTAAATALMAGGHWREAAVLYKQRLNRPWEAARCLEQGGLWAEAIVLYEELEAFENAGDLSIKLAQTDSASVMYRRAVARSRASGDFLQAARLLDEKLKEPDEALAELASGWPSSSQSAGCLRGVFRLLGRLGRHDQARGWVERLGQATVPPACEVPLVEILSETATGYPDRGVQDAAADGTRVAVARQLPAASAAVARQLLNAVARLEAQDKLLGRDCHRYLQERPTPSPAARAGRPVRRAGPTLVGRVRLAPDVDWCAASGGGDTVYAAGLRGGEVVVVRCQASGAVQELPGPAWRARPQLPGPPVLLTAHPRQDARILVHGLGGPVLQGERTFPANDAFRWPVTAGALPGLSWATLGAVRTQHGPTWLVELCEDGWKLVGLGPGDEPLTSRVIAGSEISLPGQTYPVPLYARGGTVHVGLGDRLVILSLTAELPQVVEVGDVVTSLSGSAPGTRGRYAVTFARGGMLYWENSYHRGLAETFALDLTGPVAGFTGGGDLVAADGSACEVYSTNDRCVRLKAEVRGDGPRPLAVLALARPDQFALFFEGGELAVYQVTPG